MACKTFNAKVQRREERKERKNMKELLILFERAVSIFALFAPLR